MTVHGQAVVTEEIIEKASQSVIPFNGGTRQS